MSTMFNEAEQATPLTGLTVKEAWLALQILDKAAANGVIQPIEFEVASAWRKSVVEAIGAAIGKNYDEEFIKFRHAQAELARRAQEAASTPTPAAS